MFILFKNATMLTSLQKLYIIANQCCQLASYMTFYKYLLECLVGGPGFLLKLGHTHLSSQQRQSVNKIGYTKLFAIYWQSTIIMKLQQTKDDFNVKHLINIY